MKITHRCSARDLDQGSVCFGYDTDAELKAFLDGVEAAIGYMDYEIELEDEKDDV